MRRGPSLRLHPRPSNRSCSRRPDHIEMDGGPSSDPLLRPSVCSSLNGEDEKLGGGLLARLTLSANATECASPDSEHKQPHIIMCNCIQSIQVFRPLHFFLILLCCSLML